MPTFTNTAEDGPVRPGRASFNHEAHAKAQLTQLIASPNFPCVGGKAATKSDKTEMHLYSDMKSVASLMALATDLSGFIGKTSDLKPNEYVTYAAMYESPKVLSEKKFEKHLWHILQSLHHIDDQPWDPKTSSDPESPDFEFSFAGVSFFVVGLSPATRRYARRFTYCTLVFNLHTQFERLRENDQFTSFQERIRTRDTRLQGDINPNLANFGEGSGARQYSGRQVADNWICPFQPNKGA